MTLDGPGQAEEKAADAGPLSPPSEDLARAAVGGVAWQGLSYLSGKLLVFGSTVILARILSPRDFGIVALALVFITYAEVLTDLGIAQALVYLPPDPKRNDAALTLALLTSSALTTIAVLLAPLAADFFNRSDITTMFRVLALSLLARGIGQVPDALLRKNLLFHKRVVAELCRAGTTGIISIALALAGAGPWAIVIGSVAGDGLWAASVWLLAGHRPSRRFWRLRSDQLRPLLAYGVPASGNAFLLSLVFNIDYLIVGRALGSRALGFYTLAFRIPQMAIINIFYLISAVAFPLYSRTQADRPRLQRGYLKSVRLQSAFGVAAGVGLAVTAPMLVEVVFGHRWAPTIPALEALALYAAFRSLGVGAIDVYRGTGRPTLALMLSIVRLIVLVPALLVATRWGIDGVAWTQAAVAFVLAILMQVIAARILELPVRRLARALVPAAIIGLGVALGAGWVRLWLPGSDAVRLVVSIASGAAAGFLAVWLVDRKFVTDLRDLLPRRKRTAPSADAGL